MCKKSGSGQCAGFGDIACYWVNDLNVFYNYFVRHLLTNPVRRPSRASDFEEHSKKSKR